MGQKINAGEARISTHDKNKNKQAWYRDRINLLDSEGQYHSGAGSTEVSEYKRKKVNYDLFNNILDFEDFEYVCKPFGAEAGELPAQMVNRDISSARIKAVLGIEMKKPFNWKPIAVNKEATTRKEEEQYNRIKEFVIAEALAPIQKAKEIQYQEQLNNKELSKEEKSQIEAQIQQEVERDTPDEVKRYMERDHQDPSEVLSNQILQYLIQEEQLQRKFTEGFKHANLSAEEIYFVGIRNTKPVVDVINPLRFNRDITPDLEFIEDGEWASYEYRWTPSKVVAELGDYLKNDDIDSIYTLAQDHSQNNREDELFNFNGDERESENNEGTNRVLHVVFKALRKIGFLTYLDEEDQEQMQLVDESYTLDKDAGDISIEWKWIPEVYEGYKIDADIYVGMRPIPGQFKDLNNLYKCPLPYKGVVYDNTNSKPTSLMDRLKVYQYYYNIVMYRLELLLASDKGKKLMMNINAIPKTSGIDMKKWQYFFESSPFAWFDPSEEGNQYSDVNTMAKVIDMSMASDIQKYIEISMFLEQQAGKSVGITDAMLGAISPSAEVGNTKQSIVQTSHILEPYFNLHSQVKQNVLQALIETAMIAYVENPPESLVYTLDDLSLQTIKMDVGLLSQSTIGVFTTDGGADAEVKENINQFAHAALQNQKAELSDVISIIRQKDSQQAEEILKVAEKDREAKLEEEQQANRDQQTKVVEMQNQESERAHEREKELIILKEEEKRKTDIQTQAILALGFSEEKDSDGDGELDVLEVAKHGVDADIKKRKQDLDESKFAQSVKEHDDKVKLENKKLNKQS